jgi:2-polyprenyl-6-methoxyphenol hydroxylase-like FAD-dependent oxidoreductase
VVTLSDDTTVRADLVVGADGPHSTVRRLVFGPEEKFVKPLGGYHAWVHRARHRRPGRLVSDVSGARWAQRIMRPSHDPAMA